MEGAITSNPAATGGMSTGMKFAIAASVIGIGVAAYIYFRENDNLTASAKFNREIKFTKVEPKTEE